MAVEKNVSEEQTKAYVESQAMAAHPILTSELICRDCVFRNDEKSGICEIFPLGIFKPVEVFDSGTCSEYHKE